MIVFTVTQQNYKLKNHSLIEVNKMGYLLYEIRYVKKSFPQVLGLCVIPKSRYSSKCFAGKYSKHLEVLELTLVN